MVRNAGQAKTVGVVGNHEVTIAGAVNIEFERCGAVSQGLFEGLDGVFGQ